MIVSALERALFDRLTSTGATDSEEAWRFIRDTLRWNAQIAASHALTEQAVQLLSLAVEEAQRSFAEAEQLELEPQMIEESRHALQTATTGTSTALPMEIIGHATRFHPEADQAWRSWKNMVANRVHQTAVGTPFELRAIAENVFHEWQELAAARRALRAKRAVRAYIARAVELLNAVMPAMIELQSRLRRTIGFEAIGWDLAQRDWEHVDWATLERANCDAERFADLAVPAARLTALGRGPIVLCIDSSSSMRGTPEAIARALTLQLIRASIDRPRAVIVVGTRRDQEDTRVVIKPQQVTTAAGVLSLCALWQTDPTGVGISATVGRTIAWVDRERAVDSDVVVVGDFRFPRLKPDHMSTIRQLQRQLNARFHSFAIHASPVDDPFNIFDYHWQRRPE